jgi:hypothetical protein
MRHHQSQFFRSWNSLILWEFIDRGLDVSGIGADDLNGHVHPHRNSSPNDLSTFDVRHTCIR